MIFKHQQKLVLLHAKVVGASIHAEADATFSASVNATELVFSVGASETATEQMRITSDGKVGFATSAPASQVHVNGTMQVGIDDTGHDVKFFGATTGKYLLYDQSADELQVVGKIRVLKGSAFQTLTTSSWVMGG